MSEVEVVMTLEEAQPNIIWPRLDQYKEAVLTKKNSQELDSLRSVLLGEIQKEAGDSTEIIEYFDSQCEQIESRHLSREDVVRMRRGSYRPKQ